MFYHRVRGSDKAYKISEKIFESHSSCSTFFYKNIFFKNFEMNLKSLSLLIGSALGKSEVFNDLVRIAEALVEPGFTG